MVNKLARFSTPAPLRASSARRTGVLRSTPSSGHREQYQDAALAILVLVGLPNRLRISAISRANSASLSWPAFADAVIAAFQSAKASGSTRTASRHSAAAWFQSSRLAKSSPRCLQPWPDSSSILRDNLSLELMTFLSSGSPLPSI